MKQYVNDILDKTNFDFSCHGLQAKESASIIAKHYFEAENLSFEGWRVREIPVADNSGNYPVAVVLIVNNSTEQKEISLNITKDGQLFGCNPDTYCEIDVNTIAEAIQHPSCKY